MEIEKKTVWLKPERILKLGNGAKSKFGMNRLFIIGIGKNGVDCLLRCKHITEKRFGTDSQKVRYLGIAEDSYLDGASCCGTVLDEGETIPIVPEEAIYKYLNNPGRLPQYALDWFDNGLKNYSPAAPIYGLTKRQCGRVALFHNIKRIMQCASDALSAFGGSDKSLEIIITGNMGDAFFGGMFIDLAYILKKLFDVAAYPVKINCYMFAADTTVMFEKDQREQGGYFANTLITKSELDKFQCMKKPFSQQYTSTFEVTSDKPPFSSCFIALAERNYSYTLDCAAEKILNRMEIIFSKDDDAERIMSYNMLSQAGSHDFRYLAYSTAVYEVPVDKIASYLAVRIFTRMNHVLNKNSVGQMLLGQYANQVTPDARYLAHKGGNAGELLFDEHLNPSFSARALRLSNEGAHEAVETWVMNVSEAVKQGAATCCEPIIKEIIDVCERAKTDFEKGPFYAQEIIRKCLAELRVAYAKVNSELNDMNEQVERARKLEQTAYAKVKTSALFKGKSVEQYLSELHDLADYRARQSTGGTVLELYRTITDRLTEYQKNTLTPATEAFEKIAMSRGEIIDEILHEDLSGRCARELFSVNDPAVTEKLDKLAESIPDEMLSSSLKLSGLLNLPEGDEKALARAVYSVVLRCCDKLFSMNITEICEFFGVKNAIESGLEKALNESACNAPTADDFELNRVVCPAATAQDDIARLRGEYKGMRYIWNGSMLKYTVAVSQLKGGVQLDRYPNYREWENMHYAYVNDSLKKHGIHIF
ncbi:MAG: tubulin-like doman-containing protein [Oscillospiraceae bacterium]